MVVVEGSDGVVETVEGTKGGELEGEEATDNVSEGLGVILCVIVREGVAEIEDGI